MTDHNHSDHEMHPKYSFLPSRGGIVLIGFLLIAGYFLVTEHRAHLALAIPYLPFLLLLACPFMHFFMHGGHGHDHGHGHGENGNPPDKSNDSSLHTH